MEDLLFNFGSVNVTPQQNSIYAEHPRFAQYKAKQTGSSQTERRKQILEARNRKRYDLLNHLRNIEEPDGEDEDEAEEQMEMEERVLYYRPKQYRNFLMLSEWLVDIPEDFSTSYICLPCPVGKRSLIVASEGRTIAYAKNGSRVDQFPSSLPGGCRRSGRGGYTILDCIWSQFNNTYYILDMIFWLNQPLMESETDFRFEWLKSRIDEECSGISVETRYNQRKFVRVPFYDCSNESLTKLLAFEMPYEASLDGLLFYHKETHYTHGATPLVGWLKAYMMPEILNVSVGTQYIQERPDKYVNLPTHIQDYKEERENRIQQLQEERSKNKEFNKSDTTEEYMNVEEKRKTI
ncbi:unnamed protein product [Meganyctiphanes norvegica]|uniref:Snurportin-1 n=1 Tax=Meganyctiphanes norvegica TaxID=48144 RepID=A0AAV2QPW2_MEGNR